MKTKLYKTIDKLLTYLLGVLGLSACDSLICEYGSPHATYQITGKVTDKSTGKAIPNIQITFSHSCDTIYTDNKGEYGYGINGFIAYDTLENKRAPHRMGGIYGWLFRYMFPIWNKSRQLTHSFMPDSRTTYMGTALFTCAHAHANRDWTIHWFLLQFYTLHPVLTKSKKSHNSEILQKKLYICRPNQ